MSNSTIHRQAMSNETVLDLLKVRLGEGQELHKIYTQASIVYLGINSILAVLAFKDALQRAWLFELLGILTAIFFLFVCGMEYKVRGALEEDIKQLNDRLGRPLSYTNLPVLAYGVKASFAWSFIALLCWATVFVVDRVDRKEEGTTAAQSPASGVLMSCYGAFENGFICQKAEVSKP